MATRGRFQLIEVTIPQRRAVEDAGALRGRGEAAERGEIAPPLKPVPATRNNGSHERPLLPLPPRSAAAGQPHRHRAHVPVLGRGRRGQRLAPDPPGAAGAVGRRPADRRGHGRHAGGPHHPRRPGPVVGRDAGRAGAGAGDVRGAIRRCRWRSSSSHAGRKASSRAPWDGGTADRAGRRRLARRWRHRRCRTRPASRRPRRWTTPGCSASSRPLPHAAVRAQRLGLDAIELHARARLPAAPVPVAAGQPAHRRLRRLAGEPHALSAGGVRRGARGAAGGHPVGVRLSATDWVEGGWDLDAERRVRQALRERGCAFIHVSSGGVSPLQKIAARARLPGAVCRTHPRARPACRRSPSA